MDRVRESAIVAMEEIASAVEEVPVTIEQDTEKEVLLVTAPGFGTTTIRCACNSETATICCFCRHLSKRDLLYYDDQTIGA